MMTTKSALKITGLILAFLICSFIVLIFLVDANTFKPRIQAVAKDKGIALTMRGDLHWAFWPAIGLAVNQVSVASNDTPDKPVADLQKASFLVAFIPLMRGDIQVKHLLVDGANISLEVNEKGEGNWEKLMQKKADQSAPAKTEAISEEKDLQLAIEKISIAHSQLSYKDLSKGNQITVKNLSVDMTDVNLKNKPFAADISAETEYLQKDSAPLRVQTTLKAQLALDEQINQVTLTEGKLSVDVNGAPLELGFTAKAEDLKNNLHYQGTFVLSKIDARKWMTAFGVHHKTANEKALGELSASATYTGDKQSIALKDVQLTVDKTHLQGNVALTSFANKSVVADLTGDEIILDDYLAPKAAEGQPVAAPTTTGNEPLIPVETLRKLNAQVKVGFKKFTVAEIPLSDVQLALNANNGSIDQHLSANAYSGNARQHLALDVRGQSAVMRFDANLKGLEVAPLLKDKKLDKSLHLSGAINANAEGQANGVSKNQIMDSLLANATFSGAKMQLAPINLEQQFCKLIAMVNRSEPADQSWSAYTELRDVAGKVHVEKRLVTVENVSAGVEKLLLGTKGTIDLAKGGYDFMLPLKLNRDANDTPNSITTSAHGCTVTSNYWAERSMTLLRCKGAYAQINPTQDCRPDKDLLVELTKDYAEYKIKEKHGAKIEAKKEELIKKLDDKLGGEGKAEKAKDLLKNIFKKKDDK